MCLIFQANPTSSPATCQSTDDKVDKVDQKVDLVAKQLEALTLQNQLLAKQNQLLAEQLATVINMVSVFDDKKTAVENCGGGNRWRRNRPLP